MRRHARAVTNHVLVAQARNTKNAVAPKSGTSNKLERFFLRFHDIKVSSSAFREFKYRVSRVERRVSREILKRRLNALVRVLNTSQPRTRNLELETRNFLLLLERSNHDSKIEPYGDRPENYARDVRPGSARRPERFGAVADRLDSLSRVADQRLRLLSRHALQRFASRRRD